MAADKWVILDRDGVINVDSDAFIKSPEEWQPLPGSLEAIAQLTNHGYRVVVISNQSGIARKLFPLQTLAAINQKMLDASEQLGGKIEKIYFCPHGPNDQCTCRKPRPGLFLQAADELGFDIKQVYAVGDSVRDLQAAQLAGAIPILVETGKGPRSVKQINHLNEGDPLKYVPHYPNLATFVDQLVS